MIFTGLALILVLHGRSPMAISGMNIPESDVPVVVEMFTSQGCSSCPPADEVLNTLVDRPNIIALSCHVTYWDRLGWKDDLGRRFCDMRQNSYANELRSNRVYTPQMLINGQIQFVGSHTKDVSRFITRETKAKAVKPIAITRKTNGEFTVNLPQLTANGDYRLWLVGYKKHSAVQIKAGENRGRNIVYKNTALSMDVIGSWAGEAMSRTLKAPLDEDIDGIAVIAQTTVLGPVVAAGKAEF